MRNKVIIRSITAQSDYSEFDYAEITEVVINGEVIARNEYGGCPEDNNRQRDYKWVEPLLIDLAKKLNADVTFIETDTYARGTE